MYHMYSNTPVNSETSSHVKCSKDAQKQFIIYFFNRFESRPYRFGLGKRSGETDYDELKVFSENQNSRPYFEKGKHTASKAIERNYRSKKLLSKRF